MKTVLLAVGIATSLSALALAATVDSRPKANASPSQPRKTVSAPTTPVPDTASPSVTPLGPSTTINGGLVNWESPQIHPLDMTPDGSTLLAVNTSDNRLEVFDLTPTGPVLRGAVPVGLDPVSVRSRGNSEAWVVNMISDSVSIVDLQALHVRATLKTLDEPADVVFVAGESTRAFVSCSQSDTIRVFDVNNLNTAPIDIPIEGQRPRSLAVSPDGSTVYAAIFESGNNTTILGGAGQGNNIGFPPNVVNLASGPWGGQNPPPNSRDPSNNPIFSPPISPGNNPPIRVSLIVKKNAAGQWFDDNGGDWTSKVSGANASQSGRIVGWDLVDHDVAAINTGSFSVTYATGLMNLCMGLAVNPASGQITVVGTEATNHIRYEPILSGRFTRVEVAIVDPMNLANHSVLDLNPHLNYQSATIPQAQRDRSIGDPRAIAWNSAGTRGYVTGMGSNNIVVINASGARAGLHDTINVAEGPTGLALDEGRARLYVLNRFDGSISVVSTATEAETARVHFFDPTPAPIKTGRKHLYDTHKNSGLGQLACASCHVDGKMDRLSWDLGDPSGMIAPLGSNNLGQGLPGLAPPFTQPPFAPFHPMKGPIVTQTLQDIIGNEPLHWRGDRAGLEAFSGAFMSLQGDDTTLTTQEMQEFKAFVATLTFPPNPFRNFDNSLPTNLTLTGHLRTGRFGNAGQPLPNGNAQAGLALYRDTNRRLDMGAFACVTCHTLPTGAGTDMTLNGQTYIPLPVGPNGEHHRSLVSVDGTTNISTKVPQLRNEYKKTGFNAMTLRNTAGFGVLHDGSVDSIERFVSEPVFTPNSDQEVANLTAFILAFAGSDFFTGPPPNTPLEPPGGIAKDTHAAVGAQTTVSDGLNVPPAQATLINNMLTIANAGKVGLIARARPGAAERGYVYLGSGNWQSDRLAEQATSAQLLALASPGHELTYTVVPIGTQHRIGVDRDNDGWFDGDELTVCSNPADPNQFPGSVTCLDQNGDLAVNSGDFFTFVNRFFTGDADFNSSGATNSQDFFDYLAAFFAGCP